MTWMGDKFNPAHPQTGDRRRFGWRKMDLFHDGSTFLRRRGIETKWFGLMVHHIDEPDPGMDLHDHPWWFMTLILRGGYCESWDTTREASLRTKEGKTDHPQRFRSWNRWSVHRMPLTVAHRIRGCEPGTLTLVIRGPKVRRWGFYISEGWVDWEEYDYATRRPSKEVNSK